MKPIALAIGRCSSNSPSPGTGGEAEKGNGPVDHFPAERAHMILVRPGGNKGRGGQFLRYVTWRKNLNDAVATYY